jgi:hypothetical protein
LSNLAWHRADIQSIQFLASLKFIFRLIKDKST